MKITLTKIEAWKIIHILRCQQVIPSQSDWANSMADSLERKLTLASKKAKPKNR